jgi:hypothetical protein
LSVLCIEIIQCFNTWVVAWDFFRLYDNLLNSLYLLICKRILLVRGIAWLICEFVISATMNEYQRQSFSYKFLYPYIF